jgi:FkbM family methyltransferase
MEEKIVLTVKNLLGTLGLVAPAESLVRWIKGLTPVGKQANQHRREMIRFYAQFISAGDLCFDVGANLGNRIEIFLKLGATVVAVEPQDSCMGYLKLRYPISDQVILIHKGLDEKIGERELLIAEESPVSSMSQEWVRQQEQLGLYSWDKKQVVAVTTLDHLIQQYGSPAFCKIDVEGFEYQVLKGLSQPIKALSFEYHSDFMEPVRSCVNHLLTLGAFEFNYCAAETMQFALGQWVSGQELCRLIEKLPPETNAGDIYARHQKRAVTP